jgi:hypothetical protein
MITTATGAIAVFFAVLKFLGGDTGGTVKTRFCLTVLEIERVLFPDWPTLKSCGMLLSSIYRDHGTVNPACGRGSDKCHDARDFLWRCQTTEGKFLALKLRKLFWVTLFEPKSIQVSSW